MTRRGSENREQHIRPIRRAFWLIASASLWVSACAGPSATNDSLTRAVKIETTGCEFASGRTGSGFVYEGGLVVTAAHLVARASRISIDAPDMSVDDVDLVAIDLERDLAALRLHGLELPPVEASVAFSGDKGLMVGGATSGTVGYEVRRVVELTIEEVLGTERHSRSGYEIAAVTGDGDSGSGVYDEEGRLIGMVFATGPDEDTTWVTAAEEIEAFVASIPDQVDFEPCS